MIRPRTLMSAAAMAAILALGACGGGGDKSDAANDAKKVSSDGEALSGDAPVRIANFEFKPKVVKVKPGTKVTWKNADTSIHDIKDTSPLATPPSQELSKDDTFAITYAEPGSYNYVCGIHPYMTGTVEVVP